ncbi:hypothetical protein CHS0354_037636 [Potamilus streckersoni]|uniref:Sushi, von Willebrand factor type A, EGF and pentraxin domain-containing protein 1 n=1 Tax=Potamilus streckersoni TaxID=2493646 RepID=A0AAE0W9J3_9BIVA|nr:hypothetical protein CHS0354_037636 [Potamilus streckersoni]
MGTWSLIVVLLISSSASLEKKCPSNILKKFLSDSSKAKEHYQNGETISVTCLADSGETGYDYDIYDDNAGSDTKDSSVVLNCTEGKWTGRYPACFSNCSKPDLYAILDPEYDLFFPGDNVTIKACKEENVRIEGDTTLICTADGTWIGSATCPMKQRSCNEQPPNIANAYINSVVLHEYRHGAILRYKCLQAYDQMGIYSVTCNNGQWISDSASRMRCIIGQCSPIYNREIENGRVKNTIFEVGTYAEFECYDGYELDGNARILCMADRKWYQEIPKCKPVSCPSPKQPLHGRLVQEAYNGVLNIYQSTIRYDCDKGYRVVGPKFRICQADRTWTGNDTKCEEILCDKPSPPEYGRVYLIDNSEKVGSQIEYICDEHHIMEPITSQFAICTEHGYWSKPKPRCIKTCEIRALSHGSVKINVRWGRKITADTYVPDNTVLIFTCNNGYEMYSGGYEPDGRLKCINGTLLPGPPECRPRRCRIDARVKPEYFSGGHRVLDRHIHNGTVMEARCPDWMELVSPDGYLNLRLQSVICNMGTLEPGPLDCNEKRCKVPEIENGQFRNGGVAIDQGEMIRSSSNISLTCAYGYELYNEIRNEYLVLTRTVVICYRGSFNAGIPTCQPRRCWIRPLDNLEYFKGTREVEGYVANGTVMEARCPDYMELVSPDGYLDVKIQSVICNMGTLEPRPLDCKGKRCKVPEIENGQFRNGVVAINQGEMIESFSNISLLCDDGYELYKIKKEYLDLQRAEVICYLGSFNPEIPTCQPKRCKVPEIENGQFRNGVVAINQGEMIESFSNISLTCTEGYELYKIKKEYLDLQRTEVICYLGSFNPEIPTCQPRRCVIDPPVNLEYFIGAIKVVRYVDNGTVMEARCPDHMKLVRTGEYLNREDQSVICNMGTLDPGPLDCMEKMCEAPNLVGGSIGFTVSGTAVKSNSFILHNHSIVAICSEGYRPQGSLTCIAGNWTGNSSCELDVCDKPTFLYTIVSSVILVKDDIEFSHGTKLNASCEPSSTLHNEDGKTIQTVTATTECIQGEWKPNLSCKKMCKTPFLTPPSTGFMVNGITKQDELFPHDQSIEVACSEGYRQQGTLTCNAGKWKGNSTCEPEVCDEPAFQYTIVKNGTLVNEDILFSHGTKLKASCESSFTLMTDYDRKGSGSTECIHGEWKPKFNCKKKCTLPAGTFKFVHKDYQNLSKTEGDQVRHGRQMVQDCQSGNKTLQKSICTNGSWVPLFQGCAKDIPRCRIPNDHGMNFTFLHNGTEIADGHVNAGDMIMVSCKFGYKTLTSSVIEIVYEYDYLGYESTADHARDSKGMASEKPNTAIDGKYTCDESGNWKPEIRLTCKQITCDRFDDYSFINGIITYSTPYVIIEGTVASFTCHPGYRRVGDYNRKCQEDGTWSGDCVTCQNDKHNSSTTCLSPCVPDGAIKIGSYTYEIGSKVEFQCLPSNTQYSGDNSNIRHCIDSNNSATWNGTQINCKGVRDVLLTMIAGGLTNEWRNLSIALGLRSEEVIIPADEPAMNATLKILHYWRDNAMKGKPKSLIPELIIALEKLHNRNVAEVLRISNDLDKVRCMRPVFNGTVKPMKLSYQFGESVTISSCNDGYMLENQNYLVCSENETWIGNSTCRNAICIPDCGKNRRCIRDNECQCAEGFSGKKCDQEAISEVSSCTSPNISDVRVQPSKERYAVNETVSLTGCQKGLELVGAKTLLCRTDGSWSGHAQCISYCQNGITSWNNTSYKRVNTSIIQEIYYKAHQSENHCFDKCTNDTRCKAVQLYTERTDVIHCKHFTQNTKDKPDGFLSHGQQVLKVYDKVCDDECVVPKLNESLFHNEGFPYLLRKVQDGTVLSIKCKVPELTAVPDMITCMGGQWSHMTEKISCIR